MVRKWAHVVIMAGLLMGLSLTPTSVMAKEITIDAKPATTENASTTEQPTTEKTTEQATENTNKKSSDSIVAEPTTPSDNGESEIGSTKGKWNKKKTSYYVDDEKVTGWYEIDGKTYYFSSSGKLYSKTGLQKVGKKYYYFDDDHYIKKGLIKIDGKYYYFQNKSGVRLEKEGVNKVDGTYYCVSEDFSLIKGWYRDKDNYRYYFDKKTYEGYTDWNYVGKYKYYFNKKAQLQQDVRNKLTKKQKKSYYIKVNRTASCVTVYAKDGIKGYRIPVVAFVCSAGNDTPTGSFTIKDKLRWHELMGPCWGQWSMHLTSDILFHSVYYDRERDNKSLNVGAYNRLGTMASHGCVRLTAGDCKWIYDNCKVGTKVEIYNSKKNPGPFDKPVVEKLSAGHTWDPTDPAFQ